MENFPNLVKKIDIQIQEVKRVPTRFPKRPITKCIIIEMPNVEDKERIFFSNREGGREEERDRNINVREKL